MTGHCYAWNYGRGRQTRSTAEKSPLWPWSDMRSYRTFSGILSAVARSTNLQFSSMLTNRLWRLNGFQLKTDVLQVNAEIQKNLYIFITCIKWQQIAVKYQDLIYLLVVKDNPSVTFFVGRIFVLESPSLIRVVVRDLTNYLYENMKHLNIQLYSVYWNNSTCRHSITDDEEQWPIVFTLGMRWSTSPLQLRPSAYGWVNLPEFYERDTGEAALPR